ncbi:hypothetical protein UFOVP953_51 [uncultured Caudovirales phage]|uniref:Uncharacterized protein n=1 Tax=uncultured Caudovirales phage TaxID=2100421 RepID=A0A6J5PNV1_9CAUD|nr:hypothetical protein UFOVP953_51 [uncultured Caudovirales phage]
MNGARFVTLLSERAIRSCGAKFGHALIRSNANLPNSNCGGYLAKRSRQHPSPCFVDDHLRTPDGISWAIRDADVSPAIEL